MTQVKEMTNPELNRNLAEKLGYWVEADKGKLLLFYDGKKVAETEGTEKLIWAKAPDYCTDPAASLEVQAKAIEADFEGYVYYLNEIKYRGYEAMTFKIISEMLTASPRERAEAAYQTLRDGS